MQWTKSFFNRCINGCSYYLEWNFCLCKCVWSGDFSGIDGKKISVYSNHTISEHKNSSTEISNMRAGDVIRIGDLEEIVIGISDDGRFITMPLEDYQLEQQNN